MLGGVSIYSDSIASGASTSAGINLENGWDRVHVQVGTMSTAAQLTVQASSDGGTTFYNVFHKTIQSATVATPQFLIASGVGTNGGVTEMPAGLKHVRFLASAVVSGGVSFKLVCSD